MNPHTVPANQTSFPLSWPNGWKRTAHTDREPSRFFSVTYGELRQGGYQPKYKSKKSMAEATDDLLAELRMLRVDAVVISTNVELRQDGLPYSNRRAPEDPGAAVYFKLRTRQVVLACDKWLRVEDNLYAIAKHIEALRGQERWGVGNVEQAFAGYLRLAAPVESGAATWYNALGVPADCTFEAAREAYRAKAMAAHPDQANGSHELMVSLNRAWDQARQHFQR